MKRYRIETRAGVMYGEYRWLWVAKWDLRTARSFAHSIGWYPGYRIVYLETLEEVG